MIADRLMDLRARYRERLPSPLRQPARLAWRVLGEPVVRAGVRLVELRDGARHTGLSWDLRRAMALGRWELGTVRLLRGLARPGMVAFDVGAHSGYFTLLLAGLVGPAGHVYAFEPHPGNRERLTRNTRRLSNVTVIPAAVGDRGGAAQLFTSADPFLHSLFAEVTRGKAPTAEPVEVAVTTLDDFWEGLGRPRVALIKVDIEGAEVAALRGAAELLAASDDLALVLEYCPANLAGAGTSGEELLDVLRAHGFEARAIADDGTLGDVIPELGGDEYVNLLCRRS